MASGLCADEIRVLIDLRERLLASGIHGNNGQAGLRMDQQQQQQQQRNTVHPHEHHNIDPAIAGPGMMNTAGGDSGGDGNQSDGKKGKRELSTSKRAAQNRAAQVLYNCFLTICRFRML